MISLPCTVALGVLAWALACEKLSYALVAGAALFLPSAVMTVRRKVEFVGVAAALMGCCTFLGACCLVVRWRK